MRPRRNARLRPHIVLIRIVGYAVAGGIALGLGAVAGLHLIGAL